MIKKNPQSGNTIVIADDHLNSFMNELYDADNKVALSFVGNGLPFSKTIFTNNVCELFIQRADFANFLTLLSPELKQYQQLNQDSINCSRRKWYDYSNIYS